MSEIASRVKAIIVDKLGVEESEVTNAYHGIRKRIRHFYS